MTIVVNCACGKKLKAPEGGAGRRVKCPGCGAVLTLPTEQVDAYELAESAPDSSRLDSKLWREATRRAAERDEAAVGPRPLFNLLGVDVTRGRAAALAAVALLATGLPVWFFVYGPGAKSRLLSARTVSVVTLLRGLDTQEPYNLLTGTGNRALGVKGPKLKSSPAAGALAAVDLVYAMGGPDELLLARPAADGGHILVEVQLAQGLFDAHGQSSSDYKMHFNPDAFTLTPTDGSGPALTPRLLFARFDSKLQIDVAGANTSDYKVLLPADVPPTTEKIEMRSGGAAMGTLTYDDPGAKGQIEFTSAYFLSGGTPGVIGLTATGQVQRHTPDGAAIDYDYKLGSLDLSWRSPGAGAWWCKPRYTRSQAFSSYSKFQVALLFERPAQDTAHTLKFVGHTIGTVRPSAASRAGAATAKAAGAAPTVAVTDAPATSGGGGVREPVTAYLQALADARKKAQGIVAMSNMNQIGLAIGLYAEQNQGLMPERLDQLRKVMPSMDQLLVNQRTGERPGFVYERPAERFSQIPDPARTPMLWEAKEGRKDDAGSVLYADGHIESRYKP